MFEALKRWRRRRVLERSALPDELWDEALAALPFVRDFDGADRARLRDLVVLFLDTKSIVGAGGHDVTPLQRVVIAIQACALVLELPGSLDHYAEQLGVILGAVAQVAEVAADDVPATSHPMPLVNVFREDVPRPSLTNEEALSGAPSVESERFRVPRILDEE